jgi:C_GCAxxG_C_C family probable redox protein
MASRTERAQALHAAGSACSQAVATVFADELGMDPALMHRLATGLGGGFGRKQYLCGAVSGACLVLGLAYGNDSGAWQDAKLDTYAKVHAFISGIEAEKGASDCRTLLGGEDLGSEAGRARVKELGLSAKVCDPLIARCVERLEAILAAEGKLPARGGKA